MALDSKLIQNIDIRANGDQLLKPLEAFGPLLNKLIRDLSKLNTKMADGGKDAENQYRRTVQVLQRLIGEASTVNNLMTSLNDRKKSNLLGGLDEQNLGRRALSVSKLKRELTEAKTVTDALDIRMAQLNKKFADLIQKGRTVSKTDMAKAFNTEEARRQIQKLEREISRLDARAAATGGLSSTGQTLRTKIDSAYAILLEDAKNPRSNPVKLAPQIALVAELTRGYGKLASAEEHARRQADATFQALRRSMLQHVNQNEAMLRASLQRNASKYSFTPDQARTTDMRALGATIDRNIGRMQTLQTIMSRALAPGSVRTPAALERLQRVWDQIAGKTSEALALRKAYDALPEQRGKAITSYLFGDGGLALGARIAGATAIISVISTLRQVASEAFRSIVEFEDSVGKLQAISGSTDQQMVQFAASLREVARDSRFATTEIVESATQIAQAGYAAGETAQILKDSLALATASGSTPGVAVDNLTSALGAFQLQASESTRVIDIMVQGLNRSKLSMTQLQAAIQYAGATARENGVRFEELTTIAASLANAGIRSGSTVGTGLRQLLVDLKTPTEKFEKELKALGLTMADIDVRSKGLTNVIKKLTDAGFTAEQAYQSFEVRAAASFLALRGQIDNFDSLQAAILQTGAAMEAQEKALRSFTAKWQELKNNLVELVDGGPLSTFVDLSKLVVDSLVSITKAANEFNGSSNEMGSLWNNLIPLLGSANVAIEALEYTIYGSSKQMDRLQTATNEAGDAMNSTRQTISSVDEAIGDLIARNEVLTEDSVALQAETLTLTNRFEGLASQLGGAAKNYEDLLDAMVRYRAEVVRGSKEDARALAIAAKDQIRAYTSELKANADRYKTPSYVNPSTLSAARGEATYAAGRSALDTSLGIDFSTARSEVLLNDRTRLLGAKHDLLERIQEKPELSQNASIKRILKIIEERIGLIDKLSEALTKYELAKADIERIDVQLKPENQKRDKSIIDYREEATNAKLQFEADPRKASEAMRALIDRGNATLSEWKKQVAVLGVGTNRDVRQAQVQALQGQIKALERILSGENESAGERVGKGVVPDNYAVAAMIRGQYSGANVYSLGQRSFAKQKELYDKYKRGEGPLAAKPGTSIHGSGRAIDMTPIPGMTLDQVVAFLESKGLTITEALNEKSPKTGSYHWHIAWGAGESNYTKRQQQEADKAARELQQLLEAEAGAKTSAAKTRIQTILKQAKSGQLSVGTLSGNFTTALEDFRRLSLAEFDIDHPKDGLSEVGLKTWQAARDAEEKKLTEQIAALHADFWRYIADSAGKALDEALAAGERAFDNAAYDAEGNVRRVQSETNTLGNEQNQRRYEVGVQYRQERRGREARLNADKDLVALMTERAIETAQDIQKYDSAIAELDPEKDGEAYIAATAKRRDAEEKLTDIMRERNALLASIHEREEAITDIPLSERIMEATAAWATGSGVMDDWGKTIENNIGPALELITDQFAQLFQNVVTGARSFKQAMGDMAKAFAQFVLQIIAKALALMAVKAILSAFGLELKDSPGGVIVTKKPKKESFEGGPVTVGRYGGGSTLLNGGRINRGNHLRDSALYNLAEGEYVIRNKSVRDLGLPFMDAINKHGRAGLDKVAGRAGFFNMQMPRQETNVYVVQEKQAPPMGPNDVLVTVHNDIMENGPTKRLIKQVAQGG